MTPSTDTHPSMEACPPLEDIAAFLDDTLSPEERERMTAHLARCESCYEVFIGAAEFQEEESSAGDTGEVVPLDPLTARQGRASRRIPRWFPLAASVVIAAGLGYFTWQALRPPEINLAGVLDGIGDQPAAVDDLYQGSTFRNFPPPGPDDAAEFMTGVYLLDLRLSGTSQETDEILRNLSIELKDSPLTHDLVKRYWDESLDFREPGEAGRQALEDEIQERLNENSTFSFGLWAEAGRLSAVMESPEFFERRNNRRFLSRLLKEGMSPVPTGLREPVLDSLQQIESLWDKGDLSEQEFTALATHFESVIKVIDDSEDDFLDSLEDEELPSLSGE